MTPNLTVLIFDKNKKNTEYKISTDNIVGFENLPVNINVVDNTKNINRTLTLYKGSDCIISIGDIDTTPLSSCPFEVRKKWVHFDVFDSEKAANALVNTFLMNINRDRGADKLFSIFTCAYNTPKNVIMRLYYSLVRQTYKNWNWWVLDDSSVAGSVSEYLTRLNDPRIIVIKNVTNHGVIGFNKRVIASACDGDYLVEIDHDDEITKDCLEQIKKAFDAYPDSDFVYSHAMEEMDGEPVWYTDEFALGQGYYSAATVNDVYHPRVAMTPDINFLTVRHIVGLPNHVRCWKREFYHKIGGHNLDLSVLDDMDILIRTFLYGKMCKVDKVLYVQHEGSSNDNRGRGSTTQGVRFEEILRTGVLLRWKYDKQIHERVLELGGDDPIWDDELGYSKLKTIKDKLLSFNYTYKTE